MRQNIVKILLFCVVIIGVFGLKKYTKDTITLVWVVDEMSGVTDEQEEKLNMLLEEKGRSYKIIFRKEKFLQDMNQDPVNKLKKMKQEKEQVDILFFPVDVSNYSGHNMGIKLKKQDLVYSIENYLNSETGKSLYKQYSETDWKCTSVNGENYGIPTEAVLVKGIKWHVNQKLMDKYGISREQVQNKELWELEDILKIVYKENKNMVEDFSAVAIAEQDILLNLPYEEITNYIGVSYMQKRAKATNLFDETYVRKYLDTLHEYAEKGYINSKHQMYGVTEDNFFLYQTKELIDNEAEKKDIWVLASNKKNMTKKTIENISCYNTYFTFNLPNVQQGIASWSNYKTEAMDFLTLLATDTEIQMLFNYGEEGVNYKIKKKKITDLNGNDITAKEFAQFLSGDNTCVIYKGKLTNGLDIRKHITEYIIKSPIAGFAFDDSKCREKLITLQSIYEKAKMECFYIFDDEYEKKIEKFNEELHKNGIDDVIVEINEQIQGYKNR